MRPILMILMLCLLTACGKEVGKGGGILPPDGFPGEVFDEIPNHDWIFQDQQNQIAPTLLIDYNGGMMIEVLTVNAGNYSNETINIYKNNTLMCAFQLMSLVAPHVYEFDAIIKPCQVTVKNGDVIQATGISGGFSIEANGTKFVRK